MGCDRLYNSLRIRSTEVPHCGGLSREVGRQLFQELDSFYFSKGLLYIANPFRLEQLQRIRTCTRTHHLKDLQVHRPAADLLTM